MSHVAALGAIGLLVSVASTKTLLTKWLFHDVHEPIAYSLLSALVTAAVVAPLLACGGIQRLCLPRWDMLFSLALVCVAIAVDLGLSNEAIYRLPLALQQAIASTIPAATIALETVVRQRCRPLADYLAISTLCFGAILGHIGSLDAVSWQSASQQRSFFAGELCMLLAVLAAAVKYVFAKALLTSYRREVGAAALLVWIEILISAILLPWSLQSHQLQAMARAGYSAAQWRALVAAGALGGFRFFCELLVLRYWSATTLSAANLSAHSLIIVVSIPIFGTAVTPFLMAGTLVTLAASAFYGYLRLRTAEEAGYDDEEEMTSKRRRVVLV